MGKILQSDIRFLHGLYNKGIFFRISGGMASGVYLSKSIEDANLILSVIVLFDVCCFLHNEGIFRTK